MTLNTFSATGSSKTIHH